MLQFGKSNTYTVGAHIHMAMHQARHWYHLDPNSSCASTQLASLLRSAWQGARLSPRPPLALPPLLPPALGRLSAASSLPALFLPPPPPSPPCPVASFFLPRLCLLRGRGFRSFAALSTPPPPLPPLPAACGSSESSESGRNKHKKRCER